MFNLKGKPFRPHHTLLIVFLLITWEFHRILVFRCYVKRCPTYFLIVTMIRYLHTDIITLIVGWFVSFPDFVDYLLGMQYSIPSIYDDIERGHSTSDTSLKGAIYPINRFDLSCGSAMHLHYYLQFLKHSWHNFCRHS